jgi:hypothetical protein
MASSSTQSTVFWRTASIQFPDSSTVDSILKCELASVLLFSIKACLGIKIVAAFTANEALLLLYPKIAGLPMPKTS